MFGWLRRRQAPAPSPTHCGKTRWRGTPFWVTGPRPSWSSLRALTAGFLATKEFHGAQGFVITDEVAVDIAAQAVLPVLHLGLRWYDDFVGIVVHPDEVVARREFVDDAGVVHHYDEVLAGEAMEGGPVMLSWRDVVDAGTAAPRGLQRGDP
jgi:Mlc titration factor MtfA (ptsG expression regulator)